jgi:hypothetical protein
MAILVSRGVGLINPNRGYDQWEVPDWTDSGFNFSEVAVRSDGSAMVGFQLYEGCDILLITVAGD